MNHGDLIDTPEAARRIGKSRSTDRSVAAAIDVLHEMSGWQLEQAANYRRLADVAERQAAKYWAIAETLEAKGDA